MMSKTATLGHEVTKHYECDTVCGIADGTVDWSWTDFLNSRHSIRRPGICPLGTKLRYCTGCRNISRCAVYNPILTERTDAKRAELCSVYNALCGAGQACEKQIVFTSGLGRLPRHSATPFGHCSIATPTLIVIVIFQYNHILALCTPFRKPMLKKNMFVS